MPMPMSPPMAGGAPQAPGTPPPGAGGPPPSPMAEDQDQGQHAPQGEEMPSVFIPKAALGDHKVQKGDSLDFLIVKDVDPETGEVEAGCDYSSGNMMNHDGEPAPSKMQARLDKMED